MIKKTYTTIIAIILAATIMPLFTPTAVAQEATATLQIQCDPGCILTLVIVSPADVSEFQFSIKTSNTVTLTTAQASLTGFMTGASLLPLEGSVLDEYRWFNLQSQGGIVGTLSVPISNLQTGDSVFLDKTDLLDADGNKIETVSIGIGGTLSTTTTITSSRTITSLSITTATATITSTSTVRSTSTVVSTATTTTTATVGQTTITQTVTSTSTAGAAALSTSTITQIVTSGGAISTTTTTITNTLTNTKTVEEGSAAGIYAIILAIIAIILLGLAVLRQQREDLFTRLREKFSF